MKFRFNITTSKDLFSLFEDKLCPKSNSFNPGTSFSFCSINSLFGIFLKHLLN